MEPFSLFQLFQSLCNHFPVEQAPQEQEKQEEQPPPKTEEAPSSQEAFLQFLSNHDARAKRTKKP